MGFLDLFGRKKQSNIEKLQELATTTTELQSHHGATQINTEEPTQKVEIPLETFSAPSSEEDWIFTKDSKTQIFSEKNLDGIIEYRLTRQAKSGRIIQLGKILEKSDNDTLKKIVSEIDYALDNPREMGGFNPHTLKELIHASSEKIKDMSKKHNILFTPDVHEVLDHITVRTQIALQPDVAINYKDFEKQLPKSINISELSFEELMAYGEALTSRITTLNSIKTPEDAYAHKSSLESFMRSKETTSLQGQLLALLPAETELSEDNPNQLQNINKRDIIIDCAKALETVPNEDGLLYSAYLKLEEDRILAQIQRDIHTFEQSISLNVGDKLPELMESGLSAEEIKQELSDYQAKQSGLREKAKEMQAKIETSKTKPQKEGENSAQASPYETFTAVSRYMVDNILENSIENYTKTGLKHDLALKSFLAFHPQIPNSEQAIEFLHARMSSYGQVTAIPTQTSLRSFIETTEYKTPEATESQNFLYVIANIEKEYILKEYTPILQEYRKILDKQKTKTPQTPKYTVKTAPEDR